MLPWNSQQHGKGLGRTRTQILYMLQQQTQIICEQMTKDWELSSAVSRDIREMALRKVLRCHSHRTMVLSSNGPVGRKGFSLDWGEGPGVSTVYRSESSSHSAYRSEEWGCCSPGSEGGEVFWERRTSQGHQHR